MGVFYFYDIKDRVKFGDLPAIKRYLFFENEG